MTSPTELSLKYLRSDGWMVDVCERWVPGANIRKDLFGLFDLVAISGCHTLGVQTTSHDNVTARVHKMHDEFHQAELERVLGAGWTVVVHGWRKSTRDNHACTHGRKARCGCRWTLHREIPITLEG